VATDVIERVREAVARGPADVLAVYVFGSHARGTARRDSDLDVAVLLRAAPPRTLLGQPLALADQLGTATRRGVDLVVLNTAPPDLVHRVLRDGVLVRDLDPAARIRFEVAARNAYFDLKPFLDRYRRVG
jgi:predicted nucleotidyltransferase